MKSVVEEGFSMNSHSTTKRLKHSSNFEPGGNVRSSNVIWTSSHPYFQATSEDICLHCTNVCSPLNMFHDSVLCYKFTWQCHCHNQLCRQTVVAVPCEATEQTRLYKRCHRPGTLDADEAATGQCSRGGSGDDMVDIGQHHPRCTGVDTHGTAGRESTACYQQIHASSETETLSPPSGRSAVTLSC